MRGIIFLNLTDICWNNNCFVYKLTYLILYSFRSSATADFLALCGHKYTKWRLATVYLDCQELIVIAGWPGSPVALLNSFVTLWNSPVTLDSHCYHNAVGILLQGGDTTVLTSLPRRGDLHLGQAEARWLRNQRRLPKDACEQRCYDYLAVKRWSIPTFKTPGLSRWYIGGR